MCFLIAITLSLALLQMEFMLETICEIKNNKKRPKDETVQHTRIKNWLQKVFGRWHISAFHMCTHN